MKLNRNKDSLRQGRKWQRGALALLLGGLMALGSGSARADSIGVNFTGGDSLNNLAATTSAGVVPQTNFNNLSGASGTNVALNNNNGVATTTTLTYSAQTASQFSVTPAGGDEQLNTGFIYSNTGTALTFTLNNISFGTYDIYIYNLAQNGTQQRTTLGTFGSPGSTSYYGTAPNPTGAGHIDGNSGTAFTYTRVISTTVGVNTPNADYVRFTGLSGASQTFSVTGLNNIGVVGGIQLVNTTVVTPEPETWAMMLMGVGALAFWQRKRRATA